MSPLLALFARSMREDSRLKFTYFTRVGFIGVLLLFLFSIQNEMGWSNAPGLRFFQSVIYIDLTVILLAGASYFASAITEEKEEMTLGLLRMTNLNPLAILLGKSTSRLCGALLLLAAQFPFTLLAITLGGVSMRQVVAAYCTLGAFLILLANLALLASVIARRTAAAAALTGAWMIFFFAIVPVASFLANLPVRFGILTAGAPWAEALNSLANLSYSASPFFRLAEIFGTGFDQSPFSFQAGSNLALGAGCFLLAWAVFELFCGEQKESAPARGPVARRGLLRRVFGAGRAWKHALAWKDFYFLAGGRFWLGLKFLIYGVPLVAMLCWPQRLGGAISREGFGYSTASIMFVLLLAEFSFSAASVFAVERRWQTLSSLAMLPQGLRRVAWEKIAGMLPAFLPACTYLLVGLACLANVIAAEFHRPEGNDFVKIACLLISYVSTQFVFFLHLTVSLSLRVKRGALALAAGIQFVLNFFLSLGLFGIYHSEWSLVPLTIVFAFAAVALHFQIGHRLEDLAAEE